MSRQNESPVNRSCGVCPSCGSILRFDKDTRVVCENDKCSRVWSEPGYNRYLLIVDSRRKHDDTVGTYVNELVAKEEIGRFKVLWSHLGISGVRLE